MRRSVLRRPWQTNQEEARARALYTSRVCTYKQRRDAGAITASRRALHPNRALLIIAAGSGRQPKAFRRARSGQKCGDARVVDARGLDRNCACRKAAGLFSPLDGISTPARAALIFAVNRPAQRLVHQLAPEGTEFPLRFSKHVACLSQTSLHMEPTQVSRQLRNRPESTEYIVSGGPGDVHNGRIRAEITAPTHYLAPVAPRRPVGDSTIDRAFCERSNRLGRGRRLPVFQLGREGQLWPVECNAWSYASTDSITPDSVVHHRRDELLL
jgi:hypothetical protein